MMSGSDLPVAAPRPRAQDPSALYRLLPHIAAMLKREPAVAITLGYLLVAMAGIFYDYSFYQRFGIPVLTLSQVGDFLVTGVQQPMAIVLVLSTFPLCWLMDFINTRHRRRDAQTLESLRAAPDRSLLVRMRIARLIWRVEHLWFMQGVYLIVIVLYGSFFVRVYAQHRADAVMDGHAPQVRVWINGDANEILPLQGHSWSYLGAVANYVFVFDPPTRRALVLPVNNLARMEPAAPTEPDSPGIMVAPIR
jgi:hypothetical protein